MNACRTFITLALGVAILSSAGAGPRPLKVVTSIFPLMDFACQVAGDRAEVSLLLPPGADVHTWQPRPGDLFALRRTDLFIICGANLEPWAPDLINNLGNSRINVLEAGAGLATRKEEHGPEAGRSHGADDPHVWLDLGLDEVIVGRIAQRLSVLDPGGKGIYARRADSYIKKLRALDAEFRRTLSGCRGRTFILGGHAAFGYLAARYGLRQVSLYGLSPDAEPAPRQVVQIVELMKKERLSVVFYEENQSRKMAEILARETKARLLPLNTAHNLAPHQLGPVHSFLDIMRKNLESLSQGVGCGKK
jgi:zinc transport system substrate-binding protein